MSHELTLRADGSAEMAFSDEAGTPWHSLGQRVTTGASIGVWLKEAGMDWQALDAVPMIYSPDDSEDLAFEDYKAIYRSDTKAPLAIVGAGYNIVQPRQVLEFFRDMTESGGWNIHTAGTLRGGRKIWAMAANKQRGLIKGWTNAKKSKRATDGQDTVIDNLVMATSLDGSMKTTFIDTPVCVVCANTMAAALKDNDRVITISHRSIFDEQAVKKVLGLSGDAFERYLKQAQELADTPCDMKEARTLLDTIFDVKPIDAKKDLSWMGKLADLGKQPLIADETRVVGSVLDLFAGAGMGATLPSRLETRWGLLNAVTQHVDHSMGRSDDTRLDGAWFGRGASFKAKALEVLTA